MTTTAVTLPTLTEAERARINDRNNDLPREHIAAVLDDPEAPPPDPVIVFLPANDPVEFEEALALALTYVRDGDDVGLRCGRVPGRKSR